MNVVMKNVSPGPYKGVITWTSFENETEFDKWYEKMMEGKIKYEILKKNVTDKEAVAMCSTKEALVATLRAQMHEIEDTFKRALEAF